MGPYSLQVTMPLRPSLKSLPRILVRSSEQTLISRILTWMDATPLLRTFQKHTNGPQNLPLTRISEWSPENLHPSQPPWLGFCLNVCVKHVLPSGPLHLWCPRPEQLAVSFHWVSASEAFPPSLPPGLPAPVKILIYSHAYCLPPLLEC